MLLGWISKEGLRWFVYLLNMTSGQHMHAGHLTGSSANIMISSVWSAEWTHLRPRQTLEGFSK